MIDKVKVARSFSRSASSYDSVAYFQRRVGEKLLSLLLTNKKSAPVNVCMDLGCGTGYFYPKLTQAYSDYIGVDLAEGMLNFIQAKDVNAALICADAEQLPFASESIDIIYSNLALQWCNDLSHLFKGLYRVLTPGGTLALATLGPRTLSELKSAWAQVDNCVHVNHFYASAAWSKAIVDAGFSIKKKHYEDCVLEYNKLQELTRELKLLGAHNVNHGQRETLTGRKRLQHLLNLYEAYRLQGKLPATYEVYYYLIQKVK
ncbi:MAG: malonyl-ACP O-methyltransferase BioC [Pseudomonadota bacterium]